MLEALYRNIDSTRWHRDSYRSEEYAATCAYCRSGYRRNLTKRSLWFRTLAHNFVHLCTPRKQNPQASIKRDSIPLLVYLPLPLPPLLLPPPRALSSAAQRIEVPVAPSVCLSNCSRGMVLAELAQQEVSPHPPGIVVKNLGNNKHRCKYPRSLQGPKSSAPLHAFRHWQPSRCKLPEFTYAAASLTVS